MTLAHREEGGDGPLLLLLHGAARNLEDWGQVAPLLTPRYRVVTADLRGHGLSRSGPWTWEAVVDDVEDLLVHLGAEDPVVAGHSLGGMVATLCAGRLPVGRAVNVDGLGGGLLQGLDPDLRGQREAQLLELSVAQLPGCLAPLSVSEFEALLSGVGSACRAGGLDPATVLAGLRRGSRSDGELVHGVPDVDTVRQVLAAVAELDLWAGLDGAAAPVTVIRCTRQTPSPPGTPEWLEQARADHERRLDGILGVARPLVDVVEVDATHGLLLESPELVAGLL